MAIELKARYLQTNFATKTIYIEDITGLYNAISNTTGYGNSTADPNPSKDVADAEINSWDLLITRPDGTSFSLTTANLEGLNSAKFFEVVQIPITDSETLLDGEWTFKYEVNENGGLLDSITFTQYIYNIDELETKINTNFANAVEFDSPLEKSCNENLLSLFSYFSALKAAIAEENTVSADYISAQINKLLD